MPLLPSLRESFQSLVNFLHIDPATATRRLIAVALIWVVAWLANHLVRRVAARIVASADDGDDATFSAAEKRGATIAQLLRSVGGVLVIVFAMLSTLNLFVSIGPILAGAGVLGLAISFGAQSLVKDFIAGFFVLLENQFAVGDTVQAGGKSGTVERMTMRIVQLRDHEGVLHTIPNGAIGVVSNMTRAWSRAVVDVGVAYETPLDRALEVFRDEASRFSSDPLWGPRLDGGTEVQGVQDLAENGVIIRTRLKTLPGDQWEAGREFRRRIKNRLDREGIRIPYPQRTVHLQSDSAERRTAATESGVAR